MFERYRTVILFLKEYSPKDIAEIICRTQATVYNYLRAYKKDGLQGLDMGQSTGRPSLLNEEQKKKLHDIIVNQTPEEVGFPAEMNWKSPLIRQLVRQEFGVEYSDHGTRELLYRV